VTPAGYIVTNLIGGAVAGAIGAAAGENADHPVLKGAIVTGLISGAIGAVLIAVSTPAPKQVGTSGWRPVGAFS